MRFSRELAATRRRYGRVSPFLSDGRSTTSNWALIAKQLQPVADTFWGDRWGMVADPFGNVWQIATQKETIAPEEMQKRMQAAANR